jgi:hypothetical protein
LVADILNRRLKWKQAFKMDYKRKVSSVTRRVTASSLNRQCVLR